MKFRNLLGRMLGTIDHRTGEPIVDKVFQDDPLAAEIVKVHEESHSRDWRNKRKYRTPQLGLPDREAMAWLSTLEFTRTRGGIPRPNQLKTEAGRNFCTNLERLHELFLSNGGNDSLDTSNRNLDAMDTALHKLEKEVRGRSEGFGPTLERRE